MSESASRCSYASSTSVKAVIVYQSSSSKSCRRQSAQQLAGAQVGICLGEAAKHRADDLDRIHLVGCDRPHAEPPGRALAISGPHRLPVGYRGDTGVEQPTAIV